SPLISRDRPVNTLQPATATVAAKGISQPEGLEAVARTVELAPGVALDVTRLLVATAVVDWPIAVGPHVQRAWRAASRLLASARIDVHRAPDVTGAFHTHRRDHIGKVLQTQIGIASTADGEPIRLRRVGMVAWQLV